MINHEPKGAPLEQQTREELHVARPRERVLFSPALRRPRCGPCSRSWRRSTAAALACRCAARHCDRRSRTAAPAATREQPARAGTKSAERICDALDEAITAELAETITELRSDEIDEDLADNAKLAEPHFSRARRENDGPGCRYERRSRPGPGPGAPVFLRERELVATEIDRELMTSAQRGVLPLAPIPIPANSNELAGARRIGSTAVIAVARPSAELEHAVLPRAPILNRRFARPPRSGTLAADVCHCPQARVFGAALAAENSHRGFRTWRRSSHRGSSGRKPRSALGKKGRSTTARDGTLAVVLE